MLHFTRKMKVGIIVTGGNRGFGRACAAEIVAAFVATDPKGNISETTGIELVLTGRDEEALREAAVDIATPNVRVSTVTADFADMSLCEQNTTKIVEQLPQDCLWYILINNAGTLGDLSKKVEDYELPAISQFVNINITSMILLTSKFLRRFEGKKRLVVNVSSLLAVKPYPGWGLYAMAKAGRDMLHAVIAKEGDPTTEERNIKTLNYAPGPLDTDMSKEVRETIYDDSQKEMFSSLHRKGELVKCSDSAAKLANIIVQDVFESGAHVDFYDDIAF